MAKSNKLEPMHVNCAFCPAQAIRVNSVSQMRHGFRDLKLFVCPCGHETFVKIRDTQ
jgi:hypothetical protein